MGDTKKKTTKKTASSKKKTGKKKATKTKKKPTKSVSIPEVIRNRHVFRDQLNANKYDLLGEIIKNINSIDNIKDQLDYQFRLLPFAYNKLDAVPVLSPVDPSRDKNSEPIYIEGEVIDPDKKGEFDDILKNI